MLLTDKDTPFQNNDDTTTTTTTTNNNNNDNNNNDNDGNNNKPFCIYVAIWIIPTMIPIVLFLVPCAICHANFMKIRSHVFCDIANRQEPRSPAE